MSPLPPQGLLESPAEKAPVSVACGGESPLDGICLSESDKTAVLTLIREEVKTCLFHPLVTPLLCTAPVPAGRSHLWRPELPNPGWQFTRPAARAAPIEGSLQSATLVLGS